MKSRIFTPAAQYTEFSLDNIKLSEMIRNTLDKNGQYPCAVINTTANEQKSVALMCSGEDIDSLRSFQELEKNLAGLCLQHKIERADPNMPLIVVKNLTLSHGLYKCSINISPSHLEQLFMYESAHYSGYREGGSLSRLDQQGNFTIKNDRICLYPIYQIDEHTIIPRNAGCQMSETIAVQLSYFVAASSNRKSHSSEHYGHHNSPIIEQTLGVTSWDLLSAASMTTGIAHPASHQEATGLEALQISQHSLQFVYEMDDTALEIYRALTAAYPDEIPNLKSVEMPIVMFLENLSLCLEEQYQHRLQEKDENQEELDHLQQKMYFFNDVMSNCVEEEENLAVKAAQLRELTFNHERELRSIKRSEETIANIQSAIQADCSHDDEHFDSAFLDIEELLESTITSLDTDLTEKLSRIHEAQPASLDANQIADITKPKEKTLAAEMLIKNIGTLTSEMEHLSQILENLSNEESSDETTKDVLRSGLTLAYNKLASEQQAAEQLKIKIALLQTDTAELKHQFLEKIAGANLVDFLTSLPPRSISLEKLASWLTEFCDTINAQTLEKTSIQAMRQFIQDRVEQKTTAFQAAQDRVITCQECRKQMAQLIENQKVKFSSAQAIIQNRSLWQSNDRTETFDQTEQTTQRSHMELPPL